MNDFISNFTLGLSGVGDLAAHAVGFTTTFAADTYASQVAGGADSYSTRIEAQREAGASSGALYSSAHTAAVTATQNGAVEHAAKQTANQVANKVRAWWQRGPLLLGAAVAVGVVVLGAVYLPKRGRS